MSMYKLVPTEPTIEMLSAAFYNSTSHQSNRSIYNTMLAAAPKPEPFAYSFEIYGLMNEFTEKDDWYTEFDKMHPTLLGYKPSDVRNITPLYSLEED